MSVCKYKTLVKPIRMLNCCHVTVNNQLQAQHQDLWYILDHFKGFNFRPFPIGIRVKLQGVNSLLDWFQWLRFFKEAQQSQEMLSLFWIKKQISWQEGFRYVSFYIFELQKLGQHNNAKMQVFWSKRINIPYVLTGAYFTW